MICAGEIGKGRIRANEDKKDFAATRLTRNSVRGDRVFFSAGPGARVVGILKDWQGEGIAVIEVIRPDVGFHEHPLNRKHGVKPVTSIMVVPVGH